MRTGAENDQKLSLVYFGSGPLAAKSLAFLHENFTVEAVITKPRPPHHKGPVPVMEFCQAHGLRCITPANKLELSKVFTSTSFDSKLGVVIDYGIIIGRDVIESFPLGIVNSHFSLLPQWRGADPITFSLLSKQSLAGVSLMLINEKMDEGPLLAQAKLEITPSTNAITITEDLTELSNALLGEILPLYVNQEILPVPQSSSIGPSKVPSYSRKLTKQDGILDWNKPADQLEREIRAYLEWPKSRTSLQDIDVIVTAAHVAPAATTSNYPGHIDLSKKTGTLLISCSDGSLSIDRLKPAGKNEMTVAEFIRGYGSRLATD
ncbi:methionyl-tRNA formyltransferase [soil metagenome]